MSLEILIQAHFRFQRGEYMPKIRTVRESDIPELLAIYAPYVLNTAITFEYEIPSDE